MRRSVNCFVEQGSSAEKTAEDRTQGVDNCAVAAASALSVAVDSETAGTEVNVIANHHVEGNLLQVDRL